MLRALVTVMAAAACGPGCQEKQSSALARLPLDTGVAFATTVVHLPDSNELLVGSYRDGSITRVPLPDSERRASKSKAPALALTGHQKIFRMRYDSPRGRLWVLGPDAIYLHDLRSRDPAYRIVVSGLAQHSDGHCLPDMALDHDGNAFVSSATEPRLVKIDSGTLQVTDYALNLDADQDKDFGFSAITFAGTADALYAASATTGTLWRIDYKNARAIKQPLSTPIFGACGLRTEPEQATPARAHERGGLIVAGGFRDRLQRIDLTPSQPSYRVTTVHTTQVTSVPTDFVVIDRRLFVIGANLSDHPDFNGGVGLPRSGSLLTEIEQP